MNEEEEESKPSVEPEDLKPKNQATGPPKVLELLLFVVKVMKRGYLVRVL